MKILEGLKSGVNSIAFARWARENGFKESKGEWKHPMTDVVISREGEKLTFTRIGHDPRRNKVQVKITPETKAITGTSVDIRLTEVVISFLKADIKTSIREEGSE